MDWKLELMMVPVTDGGITEAQPGSVDCLQIVVEDVTAAHDELAARGFDVSDVEGLGWGTFTYFRDPDGNRWALQQLPSPG